jgi:hypothetical protein
MVYIVRKMEYSIYIGNIPKNYPHQELENLFEKEKGFSKFENGGIQQKSYKFLVFGDFLNMQKCLMQNKIVIFYFFIYYSSFIID